MAERLHEYTTLVGGVDDNAYVAQAWGRQRYDGLWEGSFGIEPVYLEGAFARSTPLELRWSAA